MSLKILIHLPLGLAWWTEKMKKVREERFTNLWVFFSTIFTVFNTRNHKLSKRNRF